MRRLNAGLRQKISDLFAEYYASGKAGSEGLPAFLRFPMRGRLLCHGPLRTCEFLHRLLAAETQNRYGPDHFLAFGGAPGRAPPGSSGRAMPRRQTLRGHTIGHFIPALSGRFGAARPHLGRRSQHALASCGGAFGIRILRWPGPACRTRDPHRAIFGLNVR